MDLKIRGRRRHRKRLLKVNLRALNLHPDYPCHLLCEMLANFPGVEFLRTIFKTKNREKNFVVACSRPPLNVKQGIFTS